MRSLRILTLVAVLVFLTGCAFLQTATISSIPKDRSKPVNAEVSRTVFMGFNFNNDYVDDLPLQLARQCPDGKVRGILTKHETVSYLFVNTHNITAKGYCTVR